MGRRKAAKKEKAASDSEDFDLYGSDEEEKAERKAAEKAAPKAAEDEEAKRKAADEDARKKADKVHLPWKASDVPQLRPSSRICFITMPGDLFTHKMMVPQASMEVLLARGLIEELETSCSREQRY